MQPQEQKPSHVEPTDQQILFDLRHLRRSLRRSHTSERVTTERVALGQRVADVVAVVMGSWTFIIIQSVILVFWIAANLLGTMRRWDPYPFILLNLALSFQAAYAAPVIMMSQNRQ